MLILSDAMTDLDIQELANLTAGDADVDNFERLFTKLKEMKGKQDMKTNAQLSRANTFLDVFTPYSYCLSCTTDVIMMFWFSLIVNLQTKLLHYLTSRERFMQRR